MAPTTSSESPVIPKREVVTVMIRAPVKGMITLSTTKMISMFANYSRGSTGRMRVPPTTQRPPKFINRLQFRKQERKVSVLTLTSSRLIQN